LVTSARKIVEFWSASIPLGTRHDEHWSFGRRLVFRWYIACSSGDVRKLKLKIGFMLLGSGLFAAAIVAFCGYIGSASLESQNNPNLLLVGAILGAGFLFGIAAGFFVGPKNHLQPSVGISHPRTIRSIQSVPTSVSCATKRDRTAVGFVLPVKVAGRHNRFRTGTIFPNRTFQLR
jgi:hypothetical protein